MNDAVINRWLRQSAQALRRGRPNDAVQCCQRILAEYPDEPAALNNLAQAYLALGELALAEAALHHCLAVDGAYALAHGSLAEVYMAQAREAYHNGDTVHAKERSQRLLMEYPDSPAAAEARLILGFSEQRSRRSEYADLLVRQSSGPEPMAVSVQKPHPGVPPVVSSRRGPRWWHYALLFAVPLSIAGVAIIRNGAAASFSSVPPPDSTKPRTSTPASEFFPFSDKPLLLGQVVSAPHGRLVVYHEIDAGTFRHRPIISVIAMTVVSVHGTSWLIPTTGSLYVLGSRGVTGGAVVSALSGDPSSAQSFTKAQSPVVLPARVYPGEQWSYRFDNATVSNRVVAEPDLTTPLGIIRTAEVTSHQISSTGILNTTTWYGVGLGPIRSVSHTYGASISTTTWSITQRFSLIAKLTSLHASGFPNYPH